MHVLVKVIDIRSHCGNHGGENSSLNKIGNNLASLHTHIEELINQERLDNNKNLMHVGTHKIIEFVKHTIDDLDSKLRSWSLSVVGDARSGRIWLNGSPGPNSRVVSVSWRSMDLHMGGVLFFTSKRGSIMM
jgi:hypothetical protein